MTNKSSPFACGAGRARKGSKEGVAGAGGEISSDSRSIWEEELMEGWSDLRVLGIDLPEM